MGYNNQNMITFRLPELDIKRIDEIRGNNTRGSFCRSIVLDSKMEILRLNRELAATKEQLQKFLDDEKKQKEKRENLIFRAGRKY
jgi:hypothetical protein